MSERADIAPRAGDDAKVGSVWRAPPTLLYVTLALTALAITWPDGNTYEAYRTGLWEVPFWVQWCIGLVLVLVPGYITVRAWVAVRRPPAAHALALAACATWTAVYARLRMHLSAADFDDFFVMGKFVRAVMPGWQNDKSLFTFWDYPYRVIEGAADPMTRFRINGWFALVYVALVGLWLERALSGLLAPRLSPRVRAWLPWVAAMHLGPVVLSHTLHYELAAATWILVLCLVLERLRTGPDTPHELYVVAAVALARWLQAGGHNASAMGWMPVYLHGLLVLRQRGASAGAQVWVAVITASSALDILWRERAIGAASSFDHSLTRLTLQGGVLPLVVALAWLWYRTPRSWSLRRFVAFTWRRPTITHVWLVYLLCGAAIYLAANQGRFGVPIPGSSLSDPRPWHLDDNQWHFATNHARYALFFYPFLVVLLARLLAPRGALGLAALGVCAIAWNAAYVVRFYDVPPEMSATEAAYRCNTRFLEVMRSRLPSLGSTDSAAFVPIPRDHGDHYLARVANPRLHMVPVCSSWARARPDLPVIISRHTAIVIGKDSKESRSPLFVTARATALREDVLVIRMRDLPPGDLDAWCARPDVLARLQPGEIHPL